MTSTTVETARYPIAPTPTKRRGTLLDTIDRIGDSMSWLDGAALFESWNCMRFDGSAAFCAANTKDFDQTSGWVDGYRFAAYGGARCKTVGLDREGMRAGLRAAFELGESAAVERSLMSIRFAAHDATATIPGEWPAPTNLTPAGGAVSPAVGISLLEEYAGSVYTGAPVLHVPVSVASQVLGVDGAAFEGDTLRTKFGSKMAAGAGYSYPNLGPTGAAAAAGERWLYATGEVALLRNAEPVIKDAVDMAQNEVIALVERGYIVAVDCFVAAIAVNIEG